MTEPTAEDIDGPPSIDQLLDDPSMSFWFKLALRQALRRDPVDAANDAVVLADLLQTRAQALLNRSPSE